MGNKVKFYFLMNVKHMQMMKLIFEYCESSLAISSNSQENMFFFFIKIYIFKTRLSFFFYSMINMRFFVGKYLRNPKNMRNKFLIQNICKLYFFFHTIFKFDMINRINRFNIYDLKSIVWTIINILMK